MGKQTQKKRVVEEPEPVENDVARSSGTESDDEAPESVSFAKGREDVTQEARRQANSRKLITEAQKQLRRERNKTYRLQKAKKLLQSGQRLQADVLAAAVNSKLFAPASAAVTSELPEENAADDDQQRHVFATATEITSDAESLPSDDEDFGGISSPPHRHLINVDVDAGVNILTVDQCYAQTHKTLTSSAEAFRREHLFGDRLRRVPVDQLRSAKQKKPAQTFRHKP